MPQGRHEMKLPCLLVGYCSVRCHFHDRSPIVVNRTLPQVGSSNMNSLGQLSYNKLTRFSIVRGCLQPPSGTDAQWRHGRQERRTRKRTKRRCLIRSRADSAATAVASAAAAVISAGGTTCVAARRACDPLGGGVDSAVCSAGTAASDGRDGAVPVWKTSAATARKPSAQPAS